MPPRDFKDPLYAQFARIGRALASPHRLELLELLSQGEKTVEALSDQARMPLKNTSAHLRVLHRARLVETRRQGTFRYYRLAGDDVFLVVRQLQALGRRHLAEVEQVTRTYLSARDAMEPVTFPQLRQLLREGEVTVIDVRPRDEYEQGHLPGALSLPLPQLRRHLRDLPKGKEIIAYCRGPYCVYSLEAVSLLRKHGFRARRTETGLPDWRAAGLPVQAGAED